MKFLITGGAGFIGSHLVDRLLQDGEEVICLDNFDDFYDPQIKRRNIASALKNKNFKLIQGDIRERGLLKQIFKDNEIDVVLHIAARAGVRPSIRDPVLYEEVNIRGTVNLLEAIRLNNVDKFIFASSSSVYGNCKNIPFSEDEKLDSPISPYAATKKAGELLCHTYHYLYGMSITCLRFFTVYGPRQRPEMAIHKFIQLIDKGKNISVFGDGTSKRDYTYITDIIDGVMKAVENCEGYEIYNLGESKTVELRELIGVIESNLNKKADIEQLPEQSGDMHVTYADISKAKKELGYDPKVRIDAGVKMFVEWYKREQ